MDGQSIALVLIAMMQALQSYFVWKTKVAVEKTELNTNSMREALVITTASDSLQKGITKGIAQEKRREENK